MSGSSLFFEEGETIKPPAQADYEHYGPQGIDARKEAEHNLIDQMLFAEDFENRHMVGPTTAGIQQAQGLGDLGRQAAQRRARGPLDARLATYAQGSAAIPVIGEAAKQRAAEQAMAQEAWQRAFLQAQSYNEFLMAERMRRDNRQQGYDPSEAAAQQALRDEERRRRLIGAGARAVGAGISAAVDQWG